MVTFPIVGLYREPILVLEAVIVLLGFEFSLFFLYRFLKKERGNKMILAWACFFLCFAAMVFIFIFTDLFTVSNRQFFINIGYLVMGTGALIFTFNAEREINQRYHIFTIFLLAALSFLIVDFFILVLDPAVVTLLAWAPFVIILLAYNIKLIIKIKEYKLKIAGFFIGFLAFGIGYGSTTDMMQTEDFLVRFVGDISIIIGMCLISLVFIGLPSLKEVDWAKKLNKLLLLHNSGRCLCDYDFIMKGEQGEMESTMTEYVAGGIIGVSQMIAELMQSKEKLEILDHQDKKIIFAYGEYFIAALIVEEYLEIYRKKLERVIEDLELILGDLMPEWEGRNLPLDPVEKIIKRIFY